MLQASNPRPHKEQNSHSLACRVLFRGAVIIPRSVECAIGTQPLGMQSYTAIGISSTH